VYEVLQTKAVDDLKGCQEGGYESRFFYFAKYEIKSYFVKFREISQIKIAKFRKPSFGLLLFSSDLI
jgi:hypothetical protein